MLLKTNLMVTTNQKHITDTQKVRRKEPKLNSKENNQITRGETKRCRKAQRTTKHLKNN